MGVCVKSKPRLEIAGCSLQSALEGNTGLALRAAQGESTELKRKRKEAGGGEREGDQERDV